MKRILSVKNLRIHLNSTGKEIIKNINFELQKGEKLGIIGESGSGKTTLVQGITALLSPQEFTMNGELEFLEEYSLLSLSFQEHRKIASQFMALIPQNAIYALNPYEKIEKQLRDTFEFHHGKKSYSQEHIKKLLVKMGFQELDILLKSYPGELSGGMKQRMTILLSLLSNQVQLLIADEATTALDVINQYYFLELLEEISLNRNLTIIYVSHDIRSVKKLCDSILILKDGEIVEYGKKEQILKNPAKEYTKLLLDSIL